MEAKCPVARTAYPYPLTGYSGTAAKWLSLLLLLASPAAVQALDFAYTTNNVTVTITGYTGPGGAVTIPGTIDGLPVTRINGSAFASRSSLTSVTFPDSVTSIGDIAFYNCVNLTDIAFGAGLLSIGHETFESCTKLASVTIPNSVTSLGNLAFYNCNKLTSVTIGTGVTSLGSYAFSGCTSLTDLAIPASVTSIGYAALEGCTDLTSISVDAANPNYSSSAAGVLFNKTTTSLIQYPAAKADAHYAIPATVTSIGTGSFRSAAHLTSVVIPAGVTSIGSSAFEACPSLRGVTIPASVTSIAYQAFKSCTNLGSATFLGNAPTGDDTIFANNGAGVVYYWEGATGWGATYGGWPTQARIPISCTLTYAAGAHGTVTGASPQTVLEGASGSEVSAVADTGYHFVKWSDDSMANPRTDANVSANIAVTAEFAINRYTLTYAAGAHGSIAGTSPQSVDFGAAGSEVTAVPELGCSFVKWSDNSTVNPRTDGNVSSDISVSAEFVIDPAAPWLFTLNLTNADKQQLVFGMHPQATDQYDLAYDTVSPAPPLPESAVGGAYCFAAADVLYQTDVHASADTALWFLEVVANTTPVTVAWQGGSVPAGRTLRIERAAAALVGLPVAGTAKDLDVTGSVTVPAATTHWFVIECRSEAAPFSLHLDAGWNLVSLPIEPDDATVSAIFAAARSDSSDPSDAGGPAAVSDGRRGSPLAGQVWTWVPAGSGHYESVTRMHALRGYWVKVNEQTDITVAGAKVEASVVLSRGWNMFGSADEVSMPAYSLLQGHTWWWDPVAGHYAGVGPTDKLVPGRGYWSFATEALRLDVSGLQR